MQACRYEEIRSMQINRLLSVWLSGSEKSGEIHKKLGEKIDSYAAGELEHAAEAISSIWDLAQTNEALPSIPKTKKSARSAGGRNMRASLIKSMRRGSLLHRKYWARQSRGGSMGPIYLPITVSGSTLSRVDICKLDYVCATNVLSWTVLECCEGADGRLEKKEEYPEDSDCESECEGDGDLVSRDGDTGSEQGKELLPVLKIGSLIA